MRYLFEVFWEIFLRRSLYWFEINLMSVCQSVTWLTFLMIGDNYRGISSCKRNICMKQFCKSPWYVGYLFEIKVLINVCQPVCWLTSYRNNTRIWIFLSCVAMYMKFFRVHTFGLTSLINVYLHDLILINLHFTLSLI